VLWEDWANFRGDLRADQKIAVLDEIPKDPLRHLIKYRQDMRDGLRHTIIISERKDVESTARLHYGSCFILFGRTSGSLKRLNA
jgi:hypothetical protein